MNQIPGTQTDIDLEKLEETLIILEDEFNEILAAAYAALMQMPVKPETYEQYVRSEMADHQYKEPRYRK